MRRMLFAATAALLVTCTGLSGIETARAQERGPHPWLNGVNAMRTVPSKSAYGSRCDGGVCRSISVDVYEDTVYYGPSTLIRIAHSDDSVPGTYKLRQMACFWSEAWFDPNVAWHTAKNVLRVSKFSAEVPAVVLDPADNPHCFTWGTITVFDPCCSEEEYTFTRPITVQGTWSNPIRFRQESSSVKETNRSTGEDIHSICNSTQGAEVLEGGFTWNARFYPFGPDDPPGSVYSYYWEQQCSKQP
jgi:hypothetical protein